LEKIINIYKVSHPLESIPDPGKFLESMGAILYNPDGSIGWDYIAGYEKIKEEIKKDVILPFKHPDVYKEIAKGTRKIPENNIPKGILFEGPPGTGKTTMARIIGEETKSKLIYIPIHSVMSKWYGESAKRLHKIFEYARRFDDPSIMFIDEIEVFGMSRENNLHEATRRTLSVLLTEIDGFKTEENSSMIIGATNRKKDLDPALLSRFDNTISFHLPNDYERQEIFGNYAKHLCEKELKELARISKDMSGRDIKDICESAERNWASKIISKKAEKPLPDVDEYIHFVKKRETNYK